MIDHYEFQLCARSIPYQYAHSEFIGALIKWLRPHTCLEVGTHIGATAVWMARAIQENNQGHLFCIDNFCWSEHNQEEQWNSNIDKCGVRPVTTLLKGRSQEVEWPKQIDFAYIDGNHAYDVVKHDIDKAMDSGAKCIAIHDTVACKGPRKFADMVRNLPVKTAYSDVHFGDWDFLEENSENGIMILKRVERKGPLDWNDTSDRWDKPTA